MRFFKDALFKAPCSIDHPIKGRSNTNSSKKEFYFGIFVKIKRRKYFKIEGVYVKIIPSFKNLQKIQ